MTAPLYDPLAKFDDAKFANLAGLANHLADFYRTAFVEFVNNIILDCEAHGETWLPVEGLRAIAHYAATLPPPIVVEKGS